MTAPGLLIEERSASVALWIVFRREKNISLPFYCYHHQQPQPKPQTQSQPQPQPTSTPASPSHQIPLSGINIVVLSWQSTRCNQRRPRTTHRIFAQLGRQRCRSDRRETIESEERINGIIHTSVGPTSDCLRHLHPNEARSVGCAGNTLQPRAVIYSKNHTRAKFNALGIK